MTSRSNLRIAQPMTIASGISCSPAMRSSNPTRGLILTGVPKYVQKHELDRRSTVARLIRSVQSEIPKQ